MYHKWQEWIVYVLRKGQGPHEQSNSWKMALVSLFLCHCPFYLCSQWNETTCALVLLFLSCIFDSSKSSPSLTWEPRITVEEESVCWSKESQDYQEYLNGHVLVEQSLVSLVTSSFSKGSWCIWQETDGRLQIRWHSPQYSWAPVGSSIVTETLTVEYQHAKHIDGESMMPQTESRQSFPSLVVTLMSVEQSCWKFMKSNNFSSTIVWNLIHPRGPTGRFRMKRHSAQ